MRFPHPLVVACAAAAGVLFAGSGRASRLRIERSRTFVRSYVVQDGIAVPITHVITDRILFGDDVERYSTDRKRDRYFHWGSGPRRSRRSSARERRALAKFLEAYRQERERSAEGPAEEAAERAGPRYVESIPLPRSGPKTVTLFGRVLARDGALAFVVARGHGETVYALDGAEVIRPLLEENGGEGLSLVIIGKVVSGEAGPLLRVESAWRRSGRPAVAGEE